MKQVQFSMVPVGAWFQEVASGCWHLKVDSRSGVYQRFGTRYQPTFASTELVLVG